MKYIGYERICYMKYPKVKRKNCFIPVSFHIFVRFVVSTPYFNGDASCIR